MVEEGRENRQKKNTKNVEEGDKSYEAVYGIRIYR